MSELIAGSVATIVTAPIIAWTFGRFSLIAPLSNIAAGPLVAFVQPALFLALLVSPWPALSRVVAAAVRPPLALLDLVARFFAAVPGAALHMAPTALERLVRGVAAASFVRATASRRWAPGLVVAATALTIAIWSPLFLDGFRPARAACIGRWAGRRTCTAHTAGRWVSIDAGRQWDGR
jgi:competence protein ComEC